MNTIGTDLIDLHARHTLARTQAALAQAMERLSTGRRINSGADDPAGLIASERLEGAQHALRERIDSAQMDNHRLAAKDGGMSVLSDMATELEGLTVAAANTGAMSDAEREALQVEADSLVQGINHVVSVTRFNGEQLLSGYEASSLGTLSTAVSAGSDGGDDGQQTATHSLADLASGGTLNLLDGDTEMAQKVAAQAAGELATARGAIGSRMRDNESRIRTAWAELEGSTAALSQIRDTDYAAEIAEFTRAQIMEQAGIAAMMVGRQSRERVLGLLGPA